MLKPFLQVINGFYPSPDKIRQRSLTMEYVQPEEFTGWRTRAYQPPNIRNLIQNKFGIEIKYWERDLAAIEACNGVFFMAFAKGPRAEAVGVHFDEPPNWVMLLVYLTPKAPYCAGTSVWRHRATGLICKPNRSDAERLGISHEDLTAILERDSTKPNRWLEIDRIGNVYNRAVMFPGGLFHSATSHFGTNLHNGRLYQSFHFPIRRGRMTRHNIQS
jgi:hypothetical protein